MKDINNPTYSEVHYECVEYAKILLEHDIKIDAVVGIANGGTIPAAIVARVLNKPLIIIKYSAYEGAGDNKDQTDVNVIPNIPHRRILLVDDICDTGETMANLVSHFEKLQHFVLTYCVYFKETAEVKHMPNYSVGITGDTGWITFEWEVL